MSNKIKLLSGKVKFLFVYSAISAFVSAVEIMGQVTSVRVPPVPERKEDFTLWYITLVGLILGLIGAIFWWMSDKKTKKANATNQKAKKNAENTSDGNALDADKEMEWLRKNQKLVGKKTNPKPARKKRPQVLPAVETNLVSNESDNAEQTIAPPETPDISWKTLPIFSFERLELARPFADLPILNDNSLMDAIEQMQDEFEEDEKIRELTLKVLTAFRSKNSVEALSQAALYDLSANLRSKAVTILSEFDHESVFETILLANADPTREVRAAAARGLSKLTFNRADAWTRISETNEEGRMVQAARAAMESGFVDMSFDRLIHQDHKYAYEAFALMALLIKAGETEKIFNALEKNRDMKVKKAILHIIKIVKDQRSLEKLHTLIKKKDCR